MVGQAGDWTRARLQRPVGPGPSFDRKTGVLRLGQIDGHGGVVGWGKKLEDRVYPLTPRE